MMYEHDKGIEVQKMSCAINLQNPLWIQLDV